MVAEALDRQHSYFKVRGDGGVYILRRDVPSDGWALILFNASGGAAPACRRL